SQCAPPGQSRTRSVMAAFGGERQARFRQSGDDALVAPARAPVGAPVVPDIGDAPIAAREQVAGGRPSCAVMRKADRDVDRLAIDIHEFGDPQAVVHEHLPAFRRMVETGGYHGCRTPGEEGREQRLFLFWVVVRYA